jgi:hypothetical protein
VHRLSDRGTSDFFDFAQPAHLYSGMGRLLLLLAAFVLISLPFTQQFWTWDRFLHGGHDFETSVLLILTTLCLVLVLARRGNQCLSLLFRSRGVFCSPSPQSSTLSAPNCRFRAVCAAGPPGRAYNRPIQN